MGLVRPRRQDRAVGVGLRRAVPVAGRQPSRFGAAAPRASVSPSGCSGADPRRRRASRPLVLHGHRARGRHHAHGRARRPRPSAPHHQEIAMTPPAPAGRHPGLPRRPAVLPPAKPSLERVTARLAPSYDRGVLTNGPLVREFEATAAERLGVPHVVAVSSCTAGLMLVFQALSRPGTAAVMPSFTFSATAHAARWAGAVPRFAECDDGHLPDRRGRRRPPARRRLAARRHPRVRVALHARGGRGRWRRPAGVPVVFDAAHGFGATRGGRPLGTFGDAEVFSLSPTKPMTSGEGGLVAIRDDAAGRAHPPRRRLRQPRRLRHAASPGSTPACPSCTPPWASSRCSTSTPTWPCAATLADAVPRGAGRRAAASRPSTSTRATSRPTRTSR